MGDQASTFTIRELSGEARVVHLRGRALPYRPLPFSVSQRHETVWVPGFAEATQQVLGPQDKPSTIHGYWKDKYLSGGDESPPIVLNGRQVKTAREAVELFKDLTKSGQTLEVTWFVERRQGLLADFNYKWFNTHDVEWDLQFVWSSEGEAPGPAILPTTTPTDALASLSKARSQLSGISLDLPLNLPFFSELNTLTADLDDALGAFEDIVSQTTQAILSPVESGKGLVSLCSTISERCDAMAESLSSNLREAFLEGSRTPNPTEALEIENYRHQMIAQVRKIRSLTLEQRDALAKQLSGDLAGVYIAKAGDDLRDVSLAFYETPFEWRRIMEFNFLDSAELAPGQRILVPKMNPQLTGTSEV